MAHPADNLHDLQQRGVDARELDREDVSLAELRKQAKHRIKRDHLRFFLIVVLAIIAAIGTVVAVIGPDRIG